MRGIADTVVIGGDMTLESQIDGDMTLDSNVDGEAGTVFVANTGTFFHDQLTHRDYPDQHPIDAITGLREALNQVFEISLIDCGTSTEVV